MIRAWAIQLFDGGGYYATILEGTRVDACAVADARTMRMVSCVACSLPYPVDGEPGRAFDVSLPPPFRSELATLDSRKAEP